MHEGIWEKVADVIVPGIRNIVASPVVCDDFFSLDTLLISCHFSTHYYRPFVVSHSGGNLFTFGGFNSCACFHQ